MSSILKTQIDNTFFPVNNSTYSISMLVIVKKNIPFNYKKSFCFGERGKRSAYTNNEINLGKNHETYMCFSAVVGRQHIVKLTTYPFAFQILFYIYFACWLYLIPGKRLNIFTLWGESLFQIVLGTSLHPLRRLNFYRRSDDL